MRPPSLSLSRRVFLLLLLAAGVSLAPGVTPWTKLEASEPPTLNAAVRGEVLERLAELIEERYVYPDKAAEIAGKLRAAAAADRWREHQDARSFAGALSQELRQYDGHFGVSWRPPEFWQGRTQEATPEEQKANQARRLRGAQRRNFGFYATQRLDGNIGYLDLRGFMPVEVAAEVATAAMGTLANSAAVIIDLRRNGGGDPAMVQLLCSYFFAADSPVHLNSLYWREGEVTNQFWTLPYVPGKRLPEVPLYILTSRRTASAAEEFSYNMQTRERATLVGETTAGGANPGGFLEAVQGFGIFVSTGAAVNPVTGTNWEGTGVEPDVPVPAEQALLHAQILAAEQLAVSAREEDEEVYAGVLERVAAALRAELEPIAVAAADLEQLVGTYGNRRVWLEGDTLYLRYRERSTYQLLPLGDDKFHQIGTEGFVLTFERATGGRDTKLIETHPGGRREVAVRATSAAAEG